jgi:hypothetical protein
MSGVLKTCDDCRYLYAHPTGTKRVSIRPRMYERTYSYQCSRFRHSMNLDDYRDNRTLSEIVSTDDWNHSLHFHPEPTKRACIRFVSKDGEFLEGEDDDTEL